LKGSITFNQINLLNTRAGLLYTVEKAHNIAKGAVLISESETKQLSYSALNRSMNDRSTKIFKCYLW